MTVPDDSTNGSEDPGIVTTRRRILVSFLVLAWTCGVTLARGWGLPNDFSSAHWYLDYGLGFMKRALVGTLASGFARLFGSPLQPEAVDILATVITGTFIGLLLVVAWRVLVRHRASPPVLWAGLVFFSSPFIVMTAHLVGYFDSLIYLLTVVAILLVQRRRDRWAALVMALAILVHEGVLLTGLPLVALAVLMRDAPGDGNLKTWSPLKPLILPVAVMVLLAVWGALTGGGAGLRPELVARFTEVGIAPDKVEWIARWLTTPLMDFWRDQAREFLPRVTEPGVLAPTAPSLVALLVCLFVGSGLRPTSRASLFVLGAVGAPILMHAVAWDGARIATYPIGGAFLALWIVGRIWNLDRLGGAIIPLALPVLFLNTFQQLPLMDGDVERFSILARVALYLPAWILALALTLEQARSE